MEYPLDRLNSYISTEKERDDALQIMHDYRDVIDDMMDQNLIADTKVMLAELTSKDIETDANINRIATVESYKRMVQYSEIFFTEEMERVMDLFNDNTIELLEFNIRCGILSILRDTAKSQYKEVSAENDYDKE